MLQIATAATAALIVAASMVRTVRGDRAAWRATQADRAAGVTYRWTGTHLERTGPPRAPGEPLGGIERWAAAERVGVRRVPVRRRQDTPLVQMRVTR